jgi:hypothetical protein
MENEKRQIVRAVAEAIAGLIPGGGFVTNILQVTHPPKSNKHRQEWQGAVSERTNENTGRLDQHDRLLKPTTTLTGTAAQLAVALAKACPDGPGRENFDLDALCRLLPEADRQDIEDAVFDIEALGLVDLERFLGKRWLIRLT